MSPPNLFGVATGREDVANPKYDRNLEDEMADPDLKFIRDVTPSANGCEDCLRIGSWWVHLRLCLICGHVGCCDSSPNRHARQHFHATGHPIIQSFEPGEDWRWCYVHETLV
jgi:Zn-finger in ubiquitin-hydrolases and other protein